MIICEEMKKLRDALDKMGVEWVDASDEWKIGEYDTCINFFYICWTHFNYNGKRYSVINGYGSFGGYDMFSDDNKNLLEIMLPNQEVVGYLTANEVMEILREVTKWPYQPVKKTYHASTAITSTALYKVKRCQTVRCMLAQEKELHFLIVSIVRLLIELLKK